MYHGGVESVNETRAPEHSPETSSNGFEGGLLGRGFDRDFKGIAGDSANRRESLEEAGVDFPSLEKDRPRPCVADGGRQACGSGPAGDQTTLDTRVAEARTFSGDQQIAREGDIEPATGARTVDRRDRRCRMTFEAFDDAPSLTSVWGARSCVEVGDLTEIGAGEEDARVG